MYLTSAAVVGSYYQCIIYPAPTIMDIWIYGYMYIYIYIGGMISSPSSQVPTVRLSFYANFSKHIQKLDNGQQTRATEQFSQGLLMVFRMKRIEQVSGRCKGERI